MISDGLEDHLSCPRGGLGHAASCMRLTGRLSPRRAKGPAWRTHTGVSLRGPGATVSTGAAGGLALGGPTGDML